MFDRLYAGSAAAFITFLAFAPGARAQPARISRAIDRAQRVALPGHLHPKAIAGNDRGRLAPSFELSYVTLAFAQTDAQKADLAQLLQDQQTPGSSLFHQWLTPEQYADRFGVSQSDLDRMTNWLQSEGLTVAGVSRSRTWLAASGAAAQVESAFRTELHQYDVNGELHFANATEPSIPAALGGVVRAIRGLNDFRAQAKSRAIKPDYNSSRGNHYLAPNDLASIYNISSLYNAGFDGSGQKIVVAGQTEIDLTDLQTFRTKFNLPGADPQITLVPGSRNPGTVSGDLGEADLDLEWSSAVARNAMVLYVYAFDVMTAVQYAIDQNMAPVLSLSYGLCELETLTSDLATMQGWAQQANAQGMTWFAASGDSGGADCDDSTHSGLAVDAPASIPEVTGVGGTEFLEGTGVFWASTNDSNLASVLSYIPEVAWNDTVTDGSPSASGGGASARFAKPSWQAGPGVPSDNARHVPDISMNASADHDGYLVYSNGSLGSYGGTSAPTPVMAGITVLLNQYLVANGIQGSAGVGNINPRLYSLAQNSPAIFHDITGGDNIVTVACGRRSINCNNAPVGFGAGAGYDQVTGLGSVDAYLLVTGFNGSSPTVRSSAAMSLVSSLHAAASSDTIYLTATVTDSTTPAGSVIFSVGGVQLGAAALVGSAGRATATLAVKAAQLPSGSGTVTATFNSLSAIVTISASAASAGSVPAVNAFTNAASYQQAFAPGGILTIWGSQLANGTEQASSVPLPLAMSGTEVLINGIAAPLYYVSAGLVNVQIPYDVPPGPATVTVNNNGQISSKSFTVASVGPGIFTDASGAVVPASSASRGQEIAIYVTGVGAVSPGISTGAAPDASTDLANLPKPAESVTVSIGGAPAQIDFLGIPAGLVGVTQINFTIPTGANPGNQAVVVKVGGVASAAAILNVN